MRNHFFLIIIPPLRMTTMVKVKRKQKVTIDVSSEEGEDDENVFEY